MARQSIKDGNFRVIGHIEDMAGGKQRALDANYRIIASGNVLSSLIFNR